SDESGCSADVGPVLTGGGGGGGGGGVDVDMNTVIIGGGGGTAGGTSGGEINPAKTAAWTATDNVTGDRGFDPTRVDRCRILSDMSRAMIIPSAAIDTESADLGSR